MGDILIYLNRALFPEIKGGSHWSAVYQDEVEIIRKNEISLHVTEANWEYRNCKYQTATKGNISEGGGRFT